ncbi:hypothetical protein KNE206_29650 [Kitasatospora sp. NE20-6]|uniref:hypothetical protein n=1 Tax=Kitasatospora sp. NE20-6 TaxID=2859066 RepID=UPI0034DC39BA
MTNRPAPRSARLPFIASASLLALAATLLLLPNGQPRGQAALPVALSAQPTASTSVQTVPAPAAQASRATSPTPAARSASPNAPRTTPADLLAGDMPDSYLQQVLEQTQPADLPAAQEKQLVALANQVLLADLTGQGRPAFPSYFGGQAATTAWSHVRVQAGIARRHASSSQVDAHLVYAGTDPGGRAQERQTMTIVLAQASDGSWQPVNAS